MANRGWAVGRRRQGGGGMGFRMGAVLVTRWVRRMARQTGGPDCLSACLSV